MLRITHSTSVEGAKAYFHESLTRGDYYFEGQEIAGQWGGRGAAMLGLSGDVQRDDFFLLLENCKPDGNPLTPCNRPNRRPGYDFTFDVPKSVSLIHAFSEDKRIVEAMQRAVQETMREMEREMHTRVRRNGEDYDRPTGNMIWADFTHFTSRPGRASGHLAEGIPDPHLHMHVYAINATFDPQENRWKAGQFGNIKRDAPYYQAAYHVRLAGELQRQGFEIRATRDAFEIVGVPDALKAKFSRRTAEIEALAKELGITSDKQKDGLGALSRVNKNRDLTMPVVRKAWKEALDPLEASGIQDTIARAGLNDGAQSIVKEKTVLSALDYALEHELSRASELSEKRLLATTLQRAVGQTDVDTAQRIVAEDKRLLRATLDGEKRVTTKAILQEEAELCFLIRDGRGSVPPLVSGEYEFQEALFRDPAKDTTEQKQAISHVLHSTDWVTAIVGRAGTGKTTLMQEVCSGLKREKRDMIVCAPTAEASRGVLRREGFSQANTIKNLLQDDAQQARLKGNVLWVDEAGMVGNEDMLALLRLARDKGAAKVVLSGDPTQIRSVARGDAFRFLEEHSGLQVARLENIQRQRDPALKSAVESIAAGDAVNGFAKLEKRGAIIELPDEERNKALATAYADKIAEKTAQGRPKEALVISPTHREGEAVTDAIRDELKARGKIGKDEQEFTRLVDTGWTDAEKSVAAHYEPGMVLKFRQNAKGIRRGEALKVVGVDSGSNAVRLERPGLRLPIEYRLKDVDRFGVYRERVLKVAKGDKLRITGNGYAKDTSVSRKSADRRARYRLSNGDFKEVAGFTASGDIRLSNGKLIAKDYGHLNHGYCITADASQAKTVDTVFAAMSENSFAATDLRRFYVGISRCKHEAYVYTDDKQGLLDAIKREQPRRSGTDLMQENQRQKARQIGHQLMQSEIDRRIKAAPERIISRKEPPNRIPSNFPNLHRKRDIEYER